MTKYLGYVKAAGTYYVSLVAEHPTAAAILIILLVLLAIR